ncbi:R3h domain-containing protein, partial [Thalictrum thalictroides]
MSRLMVSSKNKSTASSSSEPDLVYDLNNRASSGASLGVGVAGGCSLSSSASAPSLVGVEKIGRCVSDDVINQVDQFLREALQNPRERLSILRMEQDVVKFIRDPTQQQLEFQQLPTSYLRLAAHRVAQHYYLQSMVILDNNLP